MLVILEKDIYVGGLSGSVDKILSYDTEKLLYTVESLKSGKTRTHNTTLEINYMSFNTDIKNSTRREKEEIEAYLNSLNVIKVVKLKRIPQIIFAVKEVEGKTLVYLADKKTFEEESKVVDSYNLHESFTDEICDKFELENEDECVYELSTQTDLESLKSKLYGFGLIENTELLKQF